MATQTQARKEVRRLAEIKEDMLGLLDEAKHIVRGTPDWERAKGYWIAAIRTALDEEHEYLGGSMCTMQDTIDSLSDDDEDEADFEEENQGDASEALDLINNKR